MDDLISRQAAIDALDGVMFPEDPFRTWAKDRKEQTPPKLNGRTLIITSLHGRRCGRRDSR